LLFFYLGFLIPILKVRFEFPHVIYQGLTMYLLLAIGWHGGEELAQVNASSVGSVAGFMIVGFVLNFLIGTAAYLLLSRMTAMRRIDMVTVAGYYGSDSAGTFATCVGVLTGLAMAFDAYMPVMLAVMEIPCCLVALYLVGRLRRKGMDAAGFMPDEPGSTAPAKVRVARRGRAARIRPKPRNPARARRRARVGVLAGKTRASRLGARAKPQEWQEAANSLPRALGGGFPQSWAWSADWRDRGRFHQWAAGHQGR